MSIIKKARIKARLNYIKRRTETFFYKKIVRSIMLSSRLGRRAVLGYADSGITFDGIYLNVPKGYNSVGKLVDLALLNLPTAKATRQRQKSLKMIINEKIEKNISVNKKTRILNLASGPSRYLLELVNKENLEFIEILCLDRNMQSLKFGKRIAGNCPVRFGMADAFNLRHYKRIGKKLGWKPNVVLASGLYFYYPDAVLEKSFNEVYEHIDNDGLFVFDNLIGNPNKKLLAKVCITTGGKPWEFYYRKPEQITAILKKAGFRNIKYFTDKWNMYVIYQASKQNMENNNA